MISTARILCGGFELFFPATRLDRLSILIFHRIVSSTDPLRPTVPTTRELDRLLGEVRGAFNVIPLSDAVDRLKRGALPPRALSITFDDGYGDNARLAAPILKAHGVPATIFVATGFIDNARMMWNDVIVETVRTLRGDELDLEPLGLGRHRIATHEEKRVAIAAILRQLKHLPSPERSEAVARFERLIPPHDALPNDLMMTADEIRGLDRSGIEVGAHTVSHPILAVQDEGDAYNEIRDSKLALEELLSGTVELFAYPNGQPTQDYNRAIRDMLPEIGFTGAVNTAWGVASSASDPFQLPRYTPWRVSRARFLPDLLWMRRRLYRPAF